MYKVVTCEGNESSSDPRKFVPRLAFEPIHVQERSKDSRAPMARPFDRGWHFQSLLHFIYIQRSRQFTRSPGYSHGSRCVVTWSRKFSAGLERFSLKF